MKKNNKLQISPFIAVFILIAVVSILVYSGVFSKEPPLKVFSSKVVPPKHKSEEPIQFSYFIG